MCADGAISASPMGKQLSWTMSLPMAVPCMSAGNCYNHQSSGLQLPTDKQGCMWWVPVRVCRRSSVALTRAVEALMWCCSATVVLCCKPQGFPAAASLHIACCLASSLLTAERHAGGGHPTVECASRKRQAVRVDLALCACILGTQPAVISAHRPVSTCGGTTLTACTLLLRLAL